MPIFDVAEFEGGLLIAARRNAENDSYYWRITPWVMPFYTLIPPRGGNPIGGHAWVPIDDNNTWSWSISYHPKRALTRAEVAAMDDGAGIHVKGIPGTFIPLANKTNDYLMNRNAQMSGATFSGIDGVGMQDASLQESMGPVIDRSQENLVSTDNGIIMARRALSRAMKANKEGKKFPDLTPEFAACALLRRGAAEERQIRRRRQARPLLRAGHGSGHRLRLAPEVCARLLPPRAPPATMAATKSKRGGE